METNNRFSDALAIAKGACNPSGIALSIVEACKLARESGRQANSDPAVRLMVAQLAYICGIWDGVSDFSGVSPQWGDLERECEIALLEVAKSIAE